MPPKAAPHSKKKRQMIIAGVALAALMVLYLRSRGSSSTAATDPNAIAANAAQQAAAQQQAANSNAGVMPTSTFADNGSQAAALGDAVTTGLSGVSQALQDLQASQATAAQAASTTTPSGVPIAPPVSVVVNNGPGAPTPGQPAPSGPTADQIARWVAVGSAPALPAAPASGGHYVATATGPQLIHAVGKNKWAAGPPPRPVVHPRGP